MSDGLVQAVARSGVHGFSKDVMGEIRLIAGLGVDGDAHAGVTVRHRYLVKKDPAAANLCQVHLLQAELFADLADFALKAGDLGENVTTCGVDLLRLVVGCRVRLGSEAVVEVTGLRTPCVQMNRFKAGLMKACMPGGLRRAGVMGVVVTGGVVRAGDEVRVEWPEQPWRKMGPV